MQKIKMDQADWASMGRTRADRASGRTISHPAWRLNCCTWQPLPMHCRN